MKQKKRKIGKTCEQSRHVRRNTNGKYGCESTFNLTHVKENAI